MALLNIAEPGMATAPHQHRLAVGILTDRDLVTRSLAVEPDALESQRVGDAMTERPVHRARTLAVATAGVALVGVLDYLTGAEVRLFPLYLLSMSLFALPIAATGLALLPPEAAIGNRIARLAQAQGAIIRPIGHLNVMSPPLTMTKGQVDELVSIIRKSAVAAMDELKREKLWNG